MHLATSTLASLLVLVAANPEPGRTWNKKEGSSSWSPPEFSEALANNITVMEGETAALPCVVTRLRGRSVSWMRQRDLHVISANQLIFTSDDRFKVRMDNETSSFTLEIVAALTNDSGVYECQINTRPKLSRPVTLRVQGESVGWEHNGTRLSISGPRGGVSIHTEAAGRVVTSRVSVVRAAPPDAGNYSCRPHAALPATTTVFIVDEQFPAAMHHESRAWRLSGPGALVLNLLLLLLHAR
ncbi:uncharacterized protein [Procambarus clarkii]|uniref:uncharacterized protein n=1 Tax=Procambarus clarkii TaxID=6728 RepID=UPI0037432464